MNFCFIRIKQYKDSESQPSAESIGSESVSFEKKFCLCALNGSRNTRGPHDHFLTVDRCDKRQNADGLRNGRMPTLNDTDIAFETEN